MQLWTELRARMAWLVAGACVFTGSLASGQDIVINEIMYHPASENAREEYIELYNRRATNVSLAGWTLSGGLDFAFPPNAAIPAGGFVVVAAQQQAFTAKYPGVANVFGNWLIVQTTNINGIVYTNFANLLSNTRDTIRLNDVSGAEVDRVTYGDDGNWGSRRRSLSDLGQRGWEWFAPHDGFGSSLELINPALPNEHGQNWGGSSVLNGTPGVANSITANNVAPLIVNAAHFPIIPRSSQSVSITARIIDESAAGVSARVLWRVDSTSPPAFTSAPMFDDGAHGDGAAGDGVFGVTLAAQPNGTVIEYYVEASDGQGRTRTWPSPALPAIDQGGSPAQVANALFQFDDEVYTGTAPLYKVVMTALEYQQLSTIFNSAPNSDATMNATFISVDGVETLVRYLCGVRNRGHGSRSGNPHNYRVGFRADDMWKDVTALNLNARTVHAQHFGSLLALKSGAAGANTRAVQWRVNGGAGPGGTPTYGHYAANEVLNSAWAENHFPNDSGGNVYRVIRDIDPPNFDYRGTSYASYTNTYFKESNSSENDWRDIITMLEALGENQTDSFTTARARAVANVDQWLRHLAVMNLMGNGESGLNTGNNDDYFMYRGVNDPRFILMYYDLDQIIGQGGSTGTSEDIFRATCCPISGDSEGSWRAMNWFMHWPEFEAQYYRTLQNLLDTSFSQPEFDALIDQTLSGYVPTGTISNMKNWMAQRRSYVQGVISGLVTPAPIPPVATISGEPRPRTPSRNATLQVGGTNITSYRYALNGGAYGGETPVSTAISLSNLPQGSTNIVYVIGRDSTGAWQSTATPTVSAAWVVDTATPAVRLNEVLASNVAAAPHSGTFPDTLELFNEGSTTVDLSGLRLTDDKDVPEKFTFPANTTLPVGGYLVVYLNGADGTSGHHTGFSLDAEGDQVYLFDRAANGATILDFVKFGRQVPDYSLSRFGTAGAWRLSQATFGAVNSAQSLGSQMGLKVNEILTADAAASDFVEIYNPASSPVALGGLYLTDEPIGAPNRDRIADLSFIGPNGFAAYIADGDGSSDGHLNFQLASEQGAVALFSSSLQVIDSVYYGPQVAGISLGRCPDGSRTNKTLPFMTPGGPNVCPSAPPPAVTVPFVTIANIWKYDETGNDLGTAWRSPSYNDGAWLSGPAPIGTATQFGGAPAEPVQTFVTAVNGKTTFYFRTTFTNSLAGQPAALQIEHVTDDGFVLYLNGQEIHRYNMPSGSIGYGTLAATSISSGAQYVGPVTLPATSLVAGVNHLAVEVHQSSSGSPDIIFAARMSAVIATNSAGVVINEVFANNAALPEPDGSTPDWVELFNGSNSAADVSDMSLSDSALNPRRWVFPAGSIVPAQAYLRVRLDADLPAGGTNTGFGLKSSGDSLFLFSKPAEGGSLRDAVVFGIQTADFSIGRVPNGSTNWVLAVPTIGAGNIAASLGDPNQLKLNEWLADPLAGEDDFVEIFNTASQPVALGGLWLSDTLADRLKHRIAPLSFIGAATNAWQKFVADGNTAAGADHVNFSLRAEGEDVVLSTVGGVLIDSYTYTNAVEGVSEGRLPDGAANIVRFPGTQSPGSANYLALTNLVINEVLTHSDLPLEDAIEVRNLTGGPINIGGWWLSDAKSQPRKYQIPANTTVPANGYIVFYEYQFNNGDVAAEPFAFSSAKGDEVYLSMVLPGGSLAGYRAAAAFDAAPNGVTIGRYVNSVGSAEFVALRERTLGQDNPSSVEQFRQGTGRTNAYPSVGPVVLSEIMFNPPLIGTNDNTRDEFLELRNITTSAVSLYDPAYPTNRWRLRGGVDFDFPANITIPASGSLVVVGFDPADEATSAAFRAAYGLSSGVTLFGPWSGKLDNDGERVELQRPDAPQLPPSPDAGFVPFITVDRAIYSKLLPWPTNTLRNGRSLQRVSVTGYANDPTNWIAAVANPLPSSGTGDTDSDGLPNWWEAAYNFDSNNPADAAQDADGDGLSNLQEYIAGTHPRDASSVLSLRILPGVPSGVVLQFTAVSNVAYTVQYRQDLASGGWLSLQSISPAASTRTVNVTNSVPSNPRFYRVTTP